MKIEEFIIIDGLELSKWNHEYIKLLQQGGVTCVNACCYVWGNARDAINEISEWYRFFEENKDTVLPVTTSKDILLAKESGKIGIILGTQNSSFIEDDLSMVAIFEKLGIKIAQLTYNVQNYIGGGYLENDDVGLSRFGKLVVKEMNRKGIIIDVSHSNNRTILDVLNTSDRPITMTHTNPFWIYHKRRNKSKDILRELRDHGGMLGVCIYPNVMCGSETSLASFCDMIVEVIEVMGINQVGIGTGLTYNFTNEDLNWLRMGKWTHEMDYGAGSKSNPFLPEWPYWFKSPADFPNIIKGLQYRGLTDKEIYSIMGGNWLDFLTKGFEAKS